MISYYIPHPINVMIHSRVCCPLKGGWTISWIQVYYSLIFFSPEFMFIETCRIHFFFLWSFYFPDWVPFTSINFLRRVLDLSLKKQVEFGEVSFLCMLYFITGFSNVQKYWINSRFRLTTQQFISTQITATWSTHNACFSVMLLQMYEIKK